MQIARVVGHGVATVKHPTLQGWRMLLVQPLNASGKEDGEPLLAIDNLGAGPGSLVIITSDGKAVQNTVNARNTPIRWLVIGLSDS